MSEENPFATPFETMAARIRRNPKEEFGGAVLIVPPSGEPIALLTVTPDPKGEEVLFWAQVKSKIDVAAQERTEALQNPNPYGLRR